MTPRTVFVTLPQRRILYWHGGVITVLVLLHMSLQATQLFWHDTIIVKLARLFDLDAEANIPTAVQGVALLASALLLLVIARHHIGRIYHRWLLLAAACTYASFDEIAGLHERSAGLLAIVTGGEKNFADWLFVFVPIAIAITAFVLPLLRVVPRRTRIGLVAAGLVYLGGAIGMEIVSWFVDQAWGFQSMPFRLVAAAEETLEMAGIVIFVQVLLGYIRRRGYGLALGASE